MGLTVGPSTGINVHWTSIFEFSAETKKNHRRFLIFSVSSYQPMTVIDPHGSYSSAHKRKLSRYVCAPRIASHAAAYGPSCLVRILSVGLQPLVADHITAIFAIKYLKGTAPAPRITAERDERNMLLGEIDFSIAQGIVCGASVVQDRTVFLGVKSDSIRSLAFGRQLTVVNGRFES